MKKNKLKLIAIPILLFSIFTFLDYIYIKLIDDSSNKTEISFKGNLDFLWATGQGQHLSVNEDNTIYLISLYPELNTNLRFSELASFGDYTFKEKGSNEIHLIKDNNLYSFTLLNS